MTKYLAVEGEMSRLSSACVLGCPWDLSQVTRSLEKGFFSRHIYSRGMGRNVVSIIRKNLGNLHKASPKLISPNLPKLLESKSLLLREVDEMAICLIGGPSPPFPFASAWDYYAWASNHQVIDQIRTPLMIMNAKDDPIVLDLPSIGRDNGFAILVLTRGGGHLGWFDSRKAESRGSRRWFKEPVLEWLKATGEKLLVEGSRRARPVEEVSGFVREIGRDEVAFQIINSGVPINWYKEDSAGLIAGL